MIGDMPCCLPTEYATTTEAWLVIGFCFVVVVVLVWCLVWDE